MSKKIKFVGSQMYEYELYNLVDEYDSVLKEVLPEFDFSKPDAIKEARHIAISMLETMKEKHGVGLAANQVGLRHRVFVMGSDNVGYAFFNPEITVSISSPIVDFEEGCLSFPGLFIPIKRPDEVTIKYTDMDGEQKEQTFTGLSCRTILHEMDHLNGITFTTKVSRVVLDRAKRKVKSNQKKLALQFAKEEKDRILAQAAKNVLADIRKTL